MFEEAEVSDVGASLQVLEQVSAPKQLPLKKFSLKEQLPVNGRYAHMPVTRPAPHKLGSRIQNVASRCRTHHRI